MTALSERLAALGLSLPPAQPPVASYVSARRHGDLLYLSGHVSRRDGAVARGTIGGDIDVLASAAAAMGSVDAVVGVVRLTGYVRSAPGFDGQPAVVNGASDLLVEVLGEAGRHARSAVGVSELPLGAAVEIEAILEVRD